jgi:hypothetical protein
MARVYNGMRGINIPWLYLISGHIVVEVWPGIQCTRLNERPNVSGKIAIENNADDQSEFIQYHSFGCVIIIKPINCGGATSCTSHFHCQMPQAPT